MSQPRERARSSIAGRVTILAMLLSATVAGCAGGGAELRYYLIDPAPVTVLAREAPLSIEVIDLDVPEYLERFQIAARSSGNRVVYEANHQWGEPLRKNLMRTLAVNLTRALDSVVVATPLNRLASRPDVRVQVHVERFERDLDDRVHLHARWQLLDRTGTPVATERVELVGAELRRGADPAMVVAAMQTLFGSFSERLAASIVAVAPPSAAVDGEQG
ncbi:MAG TPA: PqiC family protein [Pseudomonadales bacterium]|nr:PqiC family protein [Pseudomonadales bacterium]